MSRRTHDIALCSAPRGIPSVVVMNAQQLSNLTGPATQEREARPDPLVTETGLVVGLVVAATALWGVWRALGVDLTIHSGSDSDTSTVGVASVIVSTAVVAISALGLRRALRRRGLRTWTIVAVGVWLVSFLGPTQATTTEAGAALATFHLLVGAGIIGGVHWLHGARRARTAG
jgi:hypothetical protein